MNISYEGIGQWAATFAATIWPKVSWSKSCQRHGEHLLRRRELLRHGALHRPDGLACSVALAA